MRCKTLVSLVVVSSLLGWSCYPSIESASADGAIVDSSTDGGTSSDASVTKVPDATPQSSVDGGAQGVACGVQKTIQSRCISCHGSTPAGGSSFSLLTLEDFKKASSVAGENLAQRSLARIQDMSRPMPPSPASPVPASEVAEFDAWVKSGLAAADCSTDGGTSGDGGMVDPYNSPDACTSGRSWTRGENVNMRPGEACISCHTSRREGPLYKFAGTVYPTAHEPDRCISSTFAGLEIIIIDKNGASHKLSQFGMAGSFGTLTSFATPYTAKLVYQGRERVMTRPQTNGDCNSCHTQRGANGARGRLLLP